MYTCRECERPVNQATEVCPYCGADLTVGEAEPTEPVRKPKLAAALLRWMVLLAAMWAFLWFILPERAGETTQQAEARVLEALRETHGALKEYAQMQGGYPASLEVLGERVRIPAQQAQREGYRLMYAPGPESKDGVTGSFSLQARAGNYGYRNFYTDETGVVRATRDNRPATAQDQPI